MNAFQAFVSARPFGYIKDTDLPELIKLDRLCPVVVRCGCCRFTCPAQDVATLTGHIRNGGDYVRDASIAPSAIERAAEWQPERSLAVLEAIRPVIRAMAADERAEAQRRQSEYRQDFDERSCGGVYDGLGVVSDADPGL